MFALPQIEKMKAYVPPVDNRMSYSGMLMDFNERLQSPSQYVRDALLNYCMKGNLCMYPEYNDILQQLADYCELESDQILLTNGSGQAIEIIFRTFTTKDDRVLVPTPSFSLFQQYGSVLGNELIPIDYNDDMSFPFDSLLDQLDASVKLLIVCNPNNPTGTTISVEMIEILLKKSPETLVYVDEAYFEFSQVTATLLLEKYDNLIISRTFSKAFGLAALRLGYILSRKNLIDQLNKVRGPVDINMPALVAASAALEDFPSTQAYVDEVMKVSKPLLESFFQEKGIIFYPSSANFILFKPWIAAEDLMCQLRDRGIRVRLRSRGLLRITIGTLEQIKLTLSILTELL